MARAAATVRVQQNESGDEVQRSLEVLDRVLSEFEEVPRPLVLQAEVGVVSEVPPGNGHIVDVPPQPPSPSQHSEDDGYMSMNGRSNRTKFSPSFQTTQESVSPAKVAASIEFSSPDTTTMELPEDDKPPDARNNTSPVIPTSPSSHPPVIPTSLDLVPDSAIDNVLLKSLPPSPQEAERLISNLLPWSPTPTYQDSGGKSTPGLQATLPKARCPEQTNPYNSLPAARGPPVLGVCITAVHAAVLSDGFRPNLTHGWCGKYNEHPVTIYPGRWDKAVPPKTLAGSYERHREVRRVAKPQTSKEHIESLTPSKSYDFKKSESLIINNNIENIGCNMKQSNSAFDGHFEHRPLSDLLGNEETFSDDSLEDSLPPPPSPPSDDNVSRKTPNYPENLPLSPPQSLSYGDFISIKTDLKLNNISTKSSINNNRQFDKSNDELSILAQNQNQNNSGASKRNSIAWEVPIGEDFKSKSLKRRSISGPLDKMASVSALTPPGNELKLDDKSNGEFWPDPPVSSELNDLLTSSASEELWPQTGHGTYVIRRRKQRSSISGLSKSPSGESNSDQNKTNSTDRSRLSNSSENERQRRTTTEWKSSELELDSSSEDLSNPVVNPPLREIESNISAILRGEIIPEKTPRGFRGVTKSESAKEMLLQNFPPLPPEPLGSPDGFPPLPPSPVQEEEESPEFNEPPLPPPPGSQMSSTSRTLRTKADTLPGLQNVPPAVPPHRTSPSMHALKTRSMDAGFGKSYLRSSAETMAPPSRRRIPGSRRPPHQSPPTSHTSCSLPDTPTFSRGCDIPRAGSATPSKLDEIASRTQPRPGSQNCITPHTLHSATVGHAGIHVSGLTSAHLSGLSSMGGPARGWYPRNKPRPLSTEHLDRLAGHPSGVQPRPLAWGGETNRKPQTLPPNLSPKFFHKSPREALRRVTSLLIRKGNGTSKEPRRDREGSVFPMPHTPLGHREPEDGSQKQRRGFLKNFFKKSKHYSLDHQ